MNQRPKDRKPPPQKPESLWGRFIDATLGNTLKFLGWFFLALFISVLIEWIGMLFFWDVGHSRVMLQAEIAYLSQFDSNTLLALHPANLAQEFINNVNAAYSWIGIDKVLPWLQQNIFIIYVAISSAIDVTYTMAIRLVTVILTLPAFLLWFLVAATDGLSERDIRKFEGGIESSFIYHKVKPFIFPAIALSSGLYLTLPFSINPALFFLIPQAILFLATYWACATFKKFL